MKRKTDYNMQGVTSKNKVFPRVMISPTIFVLILMTLYPMIFTVYYSFTDYNYLKQSSKFVGLQNYVRLLTNHTFQTAIWNTVKFCILAVVFEVSIGLLLAVFVHSFSRGQKILRTLFLLPYLLPQITVALAWKMMLSNNYGIINQLLEAIGLHGHNWFMEVETAFPMIVVIDVWQNVPFVFLMLYATLQTVSGDQYEAARIDGANNWQIFWKITIPNIKGGIILCALLRTIDTFRLFDKVNVLTGGGPAGTTSTITQFLYNYGIKSMKFGLGSAGAIIMAVIVLILSSAYIKRTIK
ncbi:MAG: sugar ABC transporter permease [Eubacteriales bacterium]|nr:sugar ABC transporter permease [Eubacteriales bacterium]